MAITTLDGVIAGLKPGFPFAKVLTPALVVGRPHSLWYLAGSPGAGAAPSSGVAGGTHTGPSVAGQIRVPAASGDTHLAALHAASTINGVIMLCDRLWTNSGLSATLTSSQTVNSVAFPARSADGTANGEGIQVGLEVSGATGAGTPTLTLGYTNQAGTASRTATNLDPTVATSAIGAFYRIGQQAGDSGVRSIQTYQQSATWTSGTIHLVAYRVLAVINNANSRGGTALDAITSGFPRLYDTVCPFILFLPDSTTVMAMNGLLTCAQG